MMSLLKENYKAYWNSPDYLTKVVHCIIQRKQRNNYIQTITYNCANYVLSFHIS